MMSRKRKLQEELEEEATVCHYIKRNQKVLEMPSGAHYMPKKNEFKPKGEDAHFICLEKNVFGVADGVGSWARYGIDAGKYSRLLMKNCVNALVNEIKGKVNLKKVLREAYSKTNIAGSSTACLVALKDHCLHIINVGDSGIMLFRNKKLIYRSPRQEVGFNSPYQLGISRDRPEIAEEIQVPVEVRDIVVVGTDGLLDNIYPNEIERILRNTEEGTWPEQLAWTIAENTLNNSLDKEYRSPFEVAAESFGYQYKGGKIDDITVVVGMIED